VVATTTTITYITKPVVEQIVDPSSQTAFANALVLLDKKYQSQFNALASQIAQQSSNFTLTLSSFAQGQRINNLGNVSISNATVSGVTGLTDADVPNDITASNYLPLSS
jgi:hypothetical protein